MYETAINSDMRWLVVERPEYFCSADVRGLFAMKRFSQVVPVDLPSDMIDAIGAQGLKKKNNPMETSFAF